MWGAKAEEVKTGSDRKGSEYTGDRCLFRTELHDGDVWGHVRLLLGEHMAPRCTMGRRQIDRGRVMLWEMFCLETLGPATHVDVTLTHTTYLSIVADHVHSFMATIFLLSQNQNGKWRRKTMSLGVEWASTFSRSQSNRASV